MGPYRSVPPQDPRPGPRPTRRGYDPHDPHDGRAIRASEPIVEHDATERLPRPEETAWRREPPDSKAGRNLPLAIGAGLGLGAVVLASLLIYRPAFIVVVAAAVLVGLWELSSAMRGAGIRIPIWPLMGCALGMLVVTRFGGAIMLAIGLGVTVAVLIVYRLADGATGYHVDVPAAVLAAVYIPFLGGFAVLMADPSDGHLRVIATLAVAVLSDTGGYVAGVLAGKHPMAPKISPKKSWEGLGGSMAACAIGGALLLYFMFGVSWWLGVLFGVTLAAAATLGDLAESLLKRDLGVKDMSHLIPGHGGLMDRLDSVLVVLPVAFAWLTFLAPPSG
ncbi:MAG: phosphatidate cytidylyltransferase [Stackebrandtia sp.]